MTFGYFSCTKFGTYPYLSLSCIFLQRVDTPCHINMIPDGWWARDIAGVGGDLVLQMVLVVIF